MEDLVRWLNTQLDDDQRIVNEANTSPEMVTGIPRSYAEAPVAVHIATFAHPARVLREIDAKRRIIADYENYDREAPELDVPESVLRLLALPYADRLGYRKEWAP